MAPSFRAAKRTLRNTRIDKNYGDIAIACFAKKIWPDFRFDDDYKRRPNGTKRPADGSAKIERKIENAIREIETLSREALACIGGRRDEDASLRIAPLQFPAERNRSENFSHRNSGN